MKIMDRRETEAFCNRLSSIAGDLTALCALTETVKDAVTNQDDHYGPFRVRNPYIHVRHYGSP